MPKVVTQSGSVSDHGRRTQGHAEMLEGSWTSKLLSVIEQSSIIGIVQLLRFRSRESRCTKHTTDISDDLKHGQPRVADAKAHARQSVPPLCMGIMK